MTSLNPDHGARVVLERVDAGAPEVRYAVTVYEHSVEHRAEVRITASGAIEMGTWASMPPPWVATFVERLLKGLPKKHGDEGTWPRKITRWRDARE